MLSLIGRARASKNNPLAQSRSRLLIVIPAPMNCDWPPSFWMPGTTSRIVSLPSAAAAVFLCECTSVIRAVP